MIDLPTQEEASSKTFQKTNTAEPEQNIWIVKPGEDTNRGVGITVCQTLKEIKSIICEGDFDQSRTFIL